MKHTKNNCQASNLIIANNCGLACANCGACKCGGKNEIDVKKMNEQLEKEMEFTDEILELMDARDEITHGDMQGILMAVYKKYFK